MKCFVVSILMFICMSANSASMGSVDTCEWNPGSRRYTGEAQAAASRLEMPASTRVKLNEMMAKHQWTDVVQIRWGDIRTKYGENKFGPDISNMNFAEGRICKRVTRDKWTPDHEEEALVYVVDGRAFGWAAVCGNFFELPLMDRPKGVPVDDFEGPLLFDPPGAGVPPYPYGQPVPVGGYPPDYTTSPSAQAYGVPFYGGGFLEGGGGYYGGYLPGGTEAIPPLPILAAIPEPSTWMLLGVGVFFIFRVTRKRNEHS